MSCFVSRTQIYSVYSHTRQRKAEDFCIFGFKKWLKWSVRLEQSSNDVRRLNVFLTRDDCWFDSFMKQKLWAVFYTNWDFASRFSAVGLKREKRERVNPTHPAFKTCHAERLSCSHIPELSGRPLAEGGGFSSTFVIFTSSYCHRTDTSEISAVIQRHKASTYTKKSPENSNYVEFPQFRCCYFLSKMWREFPARVKFTPPLLFFPLMSL